MQTSDNSVHAVMDQTLLGTPTPKACSTNKKQSVMRDDLLRKCYDAGTTRFVESRESMGLLHDIDLTPSLERPRKLMPEQDSLNSSQEFLQLQRQRDLAKSLLYSQRKGLTTTYLNSMLPDESKPHKISESTINDSDFLSNASVEAFWPKDISTPRSSAASADIEGSMANETNPAGSISKMLDQLDNSNLSITDICKHFESLLKTDDSVMRDSFLSSPDQAANMILEDEKAWRQEFDIIPQQIHDSVFSNLRESVIMDEKPSMGEFFKLKSDECSSIFTKQSPEKDRSLAALVTNSTMIDESKNSARSFNISDDHIFNDKKTSADYNISDIVRLLSNESLSKSHLVDCFINGGCKPKQENDIVSTIQEPPSLMSSFSNKKKQEQELNAMQEQLNLLRNSMLSSKCYVPKKAEYTDTFASEKLLTINASSCKSSLEDLSDKENTASVRNVSPCGNPRCRSPNRSPNRSLSSLRSGSSLDYLVDGKVPIESTKIELVWTTVKVGKSASQDFVLRNKMHQKIRFQIVVTGSCFKIVKPEGESQVPMSVFLHPLESRSFSVTFTPSAIGAYSERLLIQPITKAVVQNKSCSQRIMLHGYGGHISPDVRKLLKDSTGKYWLPLGYIDDTIDTITRNFVITNSGTLTAFVDCTISLKYVQVFIGLRITPNVAVIPAGQSQQFQVIYVPNKDDFRRLKYGRSFTSNVCEVVVIKCVFGAEALRGRIRRLAKKLDVAVTSADPLTTRLIEYFPEENIPSDIAMISENVSSLKYLIQHLNSKEIIVTVEQDLDKTIVPNHNDSTSFQTLCATSNDVTCVRSNFDFFNVHPKTLVLCPKIKHSDVVFLMNNSDKVIHYKIALSKALVHVIPPSGDISSVSTAIIKIACKDDIDIHKNHCVKLTVFSDNSSFEVDIQIMCLNLPS